MPPKASGTPVKDDAAKDLKDLQFLLTCIKTSTNVIQVNYEELTKELKNQGLDLNNAAIRMRVGRMAKAVGVTVKGTTGVIANDDDVLQPKSSPKRNAAGKKRAGNGMDDQDELGKSPPKKPKFEVSVGNVNNQVEE